MIKLKKRLQTIVDIIPDNTKLIDIGCDHAYLSIYLASNKNNMKIIASDSNINAYNIALSNVKENNLDSVIDVRLGNGLSVVSKEEIDTVVIAGMGSMTIVDILKEGYEKLVNVNTIILQSNTDLYYLRKNVVKLGYYIDKEIVVKDSGIYYTVIVLKKGKKKYRYDDLYFGPMDKVLINQTLIDKINNEYNKKICIYKNIPKNKFIKKFKLKLLINKYIKILNKIK